MGPSAVSVACEGRFTPQAAASDLPLPADLRGLRHPNPRDEVALSVDFGRVVAKGTALLTEVRRMFWYIVLGGAAASAIYAVMRGQNPLIWFFASAPGVPLLAMMPDSKKGLGEQRRARRSIGDKLGMMTGAAVVGVSIVLAIIGVI